MKKTILPILCLFFFLIGPAQVSKTVNVATAGTVSTLLTSTAKSTVTNLTVTGTIDARDFVTMRDNMPALAVLDISAVNIAAYNGSGGTYTDTSYPANQLPEYSFSHGGTAKTSLVTIKLPDSIDSIGPSAFQNCTGLTSMVIPDLVTSIGGYAFYDCPGLSSITLPSSIILIGKSAFAFCTITTLTIPNSVTTIGDYAFAYSTGLSNITIGKSVTSIGNRVFDGCTNLAIITSLNPTPPALGIYCFDSDPVTSVYVPAPALTAYQSAPEWSNLSSYYTFSTTAISNVINGNEKVYAVPSGIVVDGTSAGEPITLYSVDGIPLQRTISQGDRMILPAQSGQMYLVKTQSQTFKVIY